MENEYLIFLGCATHYAVGQMPLTIEVFDNNKKLLQTLQR